MNIDLDTLTTFFMWTSIINGALLALWTIVFIFMPETLYNTQRKWFPIPRELFNVALYSLLGLFKLLFIIFSLTPYLSLLIIT